ncbi:MAG: amidase [Betaproteobacteria bacterium]|nr:amidase [Betaproteobacteria bacterium]
MSQHALSSLREQTRALRAGAINVPQLLESALKRINAIEPAINSFITLVAADSLREEASALQRELDAGRSRGPLHGMPIGIKDIIQTRGLRTTGGSAALDDWVPDEDATAVAKLRKAGALILGKHNTHEFAIGVTTNNERFGACLNPWHQGHIPGGSSGGSGAAVGAGLCVGALGTDTGSSIRRPAAFCGAVGLKPRYGRVSRHGVMLVSWSMDHVGPLAASVFDAVAMLDAIAGFDAKDPATRNEPWEAALPTLSAPHGLRRAGVPRRWIETTCSPGVGARFNEACKVAERAGLQLVDIEPPDAIDLLNALRLISLVETHVAHEERFAKVGERYSDELKALVRLGGYIPAPHYVKAQQLRAKTRAWLADQFKDIDLILSPTMPIVAPRVAGRNFEKTPPSVVADSSGVFCSFGALGGLESISVPMGLSDGLPCGLLLTGPGRVERALLRLAAAIEMQLPPLPELPI